jgi:hypothetical protein
MNTEKYYEEFHDQWWWRRLHTCLCDPIFKATWDIGQRAAFLYELERRIVGEYQYGLPWPDLSHGHRMLLIKKWPLLTPDAQGAISFADRHHYKGWTPPMLISVNLAHSKKTILKEFEKWLDDYLKDRPHARNAGRNLRPMSWKSIELIDIKEAHPKEILNESERSQISKAKKRFWQNSVDK